MEGEKKKKPLKAAKTSHKKQHVPGKSTFKFRNIGNQGKQKVAVKCYSLNYEKKKEKKKIQG